MVNMLYYLYRIVQIFPSVKCVSCCHNDSFNSFFPSFIFLLWHFLWRGPINLQWEQKTSTDSETVTMSFYSSVAIFYYKLHTSQKRMKYLISYLPSLLSLIVQHEHKYTTLSATTHSLLYSHSLSLSHTLFLSLPLSFSLSHTQMWTKRWKLKWSWFW